VSEEQRKVEEADFDELQQMDLEFFEEAHNHNWHEY
jgi:hypothetical protein